MKLIPPSHFLRFFVIYNDGVRKTFEVEPSGTVTEIGWLGDKTRISNNLDGAWSTEFVKAYNEAVKPPHPAELY